MWLFNRVKYTTTQMHLTLWFDDADCWVYPLLQKVKKSLSFTPLQGVESGVDLFPSTHCNGHEIEFAIPHCAHSQYTLCYDQLSYNILTLILTIYSWIIFAHFKVNSSGIPGPFWRFLTIYERHLFHDTPLCNEHIKVFDAGFDPCDTNVSTRDNFTCENHPKFNALEIIWKTLSL